MLKSCEKIELKVKAQHLHYLMLFDYQLIEIQRHT